MNILVLNGPNLNLLGTREPETYGATTLGDLSDMLARTFKHVDFTFFQSNHEGELIDRIQQAARENIDGIVFNPGAYTHTSIALRDAIAGVQIPLLRSTYLTFTHAKLFAIDPCLRRYARAKFADWD